MTLAGQQLGHYQLQQRIGKGAMGEVYQALDMTGAHPVVALKLLNPEFADDLNFRARFIREIRLCSALEHPNIVPIWDYGTANDYLYFAMPFISGQTLSRLMARRAFSPAFVWDMLHPVATALDYAHQMGIAHRDVKPNNVMLERVESRLEVYLMDFGLAKQAGADATLTETGISIGTPEYMSPEAAMGENITPLTDVYSLAVMLYELLIGVLPFDKGEAHLTALAQVNAPPPPLTERQPHFPPALEKVVLKSLSKRPDQRHPSAGALAQDYYQALKSLSPNQMQAEYWIV